MGHLRCLLQLITIRISRMRKLRLREVNRWSEVTQPWLARTSSGCRDRIDWRSRQEDQLGGHRAGPGGGQRTKIEEKYVRYTEELGFVDSSGEGLEVT